MTTVESICKLDSSNQFPHFSVGVSVSVIVSVRSVTELASSQRTDRVGQLLDGSDRDKQKY